MTAHRFLKRIITVFIIFAAAMAICFAAAPSFAAGKGITYHDTEAGAAAELREHMTARDEKVTIGVKAEPDQEELKQMIGRLVAEACEHTGEPDEGDYITFQYASYSGEAHTDRDGVTPVVVIDYKLSYYDDAGQEAEADKKVDEIIDSLELEEKNEYEKIKAVYDYICDNVEYEAAESDIDVRRTAYGALVDGRAVCQGYSVSLYRLLLEAGIDNRIIYGVSASPDGAMGNHTWNIVRLYGRYYYIDPTWGDSAGGREFFLRPAGTSFEDSHIADEKYMDEAFKERYVMADEEFRPETSRFLEMAGGMVKRLADSMRAAFLHDKG